MFANERRLSIVNMVNQSGSVTVAELMEAFQVSIETVRRDLEFLEKKKLINRVHGGAVSRKGMQKIKRLTERRSEHIDLKRELSKTAMRFIQEGDVIAIDSGATAIIFAQILKESFSTLTVITNSPEVLEILSDKEGIRLIVIGGTYMHEEKAFCGYIAVNSIESLHVGKAFVFASCISNKYGIGTDFEKFVDIQRAYIRISDEIFVLADSSKFGHNALYKVCDISEAFTIITDSQIPKLICDSFENDGIILVR